MVALLPPPLSLSLSLCAHKKCSMLQRMRCFKTRLRRTRICTLPSSSCSMRFSSMTNDNGCHLPSVCVCVCVLFTMPATWGIFKHLQAKFFLEIAQFSSRKTCENYLGIFLQVLCRFLWLPRTSVCSGHMGTYVASCLPPSSPYVPTKHLLEIYRLQILIKDAGDECRRFILVSPSLSLSFCTFLCCIYASSFSLPTSSALLLLV